MPEFLEQAKAEVRPEDFEHPEAQLLFSGVISGADSSTGALAKEAIFMVESQLDELGGNKPALLRELYKALALFKISRLKKRQQQPANRN